MDSISNAELMELFFAAQELLDAQFQYWLSASIAAIVASFVAGDRLTRNMSYILVVLYLGASALFILRYFAVAGTLSLYGAESTIRGLIGDAGRQLTPLLQAIRVILFVTGVVATVWFLLTKKTKRKVIEMNWDAISAIGEAVGAAAVVLTLVFLAIQVRHNTRSMDESNRLERASAIDRHSDSVGRWRGRLADNEELARIWASARNNDLESDNTLSELDVIRLDNLWIDFVNAQRSNYVRAKIVGEDGLARQALLAVAAEIHQSSLLRERWEGTRSWHDLVSPDFVASVEAALVEIVDWQVKDPFPSRV